MKTERGWRRLRMVDITVPACTRCNNRWLAVLEGDVQPLLSPMILGQERTLSAGDQRLLATWAVKTALMLDLASPAPLIPTGYFHEFQQLREPLPSHLVWLGAYLGQMAMGAEHRGLHLGISNDEPPNAFVTTFHVFRVVFQVVGHFAAGGATINDSRLLAAGLWPIAPLRYPSIDWPRARIAFGDNALRELAQSMSGVVND